MSASEHRIPPGNEAKPGPGPCTRAGPPRTRPLPCYRVGHAGSGSSTRPRGRRWGQRASALLAEWFCLSTECSRCLEYLSEKTDKPPFYGEANDKHMNSTKCQSF